MEKRHQTYVAVVFLAPTADYQEHVFAVDARDHEQDASWIASQFSDAHAFYYYDIQTDLHFDNNLHLAAHHTRTEFSPCYYIDAQLLNLKDIVALPFTSTSVCLLADMIEHEMDTAIRLRDGNVRLEQAPFELVSTS